MPRGRGRGGQNQGQGQGGGGPLSVYISKLEVTSGAKDGELSFKLNIELTKPTQHQTHVKVIIQGEKVAIEKISNNLEQTYTRKYDELAANEVRVELLTDSRKGETEKFPPPADTGPKKSAKIKRMQVFMTGLGADGMNHGVVRTYDEKGKPASGKVLFYPGVEKFSINGNDYKDSAPVPVDVTDTGTFAMRVKVSKDTNAKFVHDDAGETEEYLLLKKR